MRLCLPSELLCLTKMSVYVKSCIINVMQQVSFPLSMMMQHVRAKLDLQTPMQIHCKWYHKKCSVNTTFWKKKKKREDVEGLCQHRVLPQINKYLERVMRGDKCLMKSRTALSGLAVGFFLSSLGLKINPSIPPSSIHTSTSLHSFSGPSLR